MILITERHKSKISGIPGCFDRVILSGTLPQICYADGMTSYLRYKKVRVFDYRKFTEPFGKQIRENAEQLAKSFGVEIKHLNKSKLDKDDLVKSVLKKKAKANETIEGLFFVISAMERCPTYKPWHNKKTGKTYLLSDNSQCLHYYFYIMDKDLGLCYARVPTWCPFRLQIYFNGHNWLASRLDQEGIKYAMADNAFIKISNFQEAQKISDSFPVVSLHKKSDEFARTYCPVFESFGQVYHWSITQAEYATDIIFKSQKDLQKIYADLVATAIHTVKPENIATFLGRKLNGNYEGEAGNRYNVRTEGACIKHSMGKVSIKMYDKFQQVLRIETTTNDVSFFKHYRMVEHKDGSNSYQISRQLKRLKIHGLIKKAKNSYKYYLTRLGKQVILIVLKIKEMVIIPALNY